MADSNDENDQQTIQTNNVLTLIWREMQHCFGSIAGLIAILPIVVGVAGATWIIASIVYKSSGPSEALLE